MSTIRRLTNRGFTVVELLIVIVVIGILASLIVVAYNGSRESAAHGKMLSALSSYEQLLRSYKAQHGSYPPTQLINMRGLYESDILETYAGQPRGIACLGDPNIDYPASSPFAANECATNGQGIVTPQVNKALRSSALPSTVIEGSKPIGSSGTFTIRFPGLGGDPTSFTNTYMRGIFYLSQRKPDGTSQSTFAGFLYQGNESCGHAEKVTVNGLSDTYACILALR